MRRPRMLNYAQMQNSTMTRIVLLPASFRKKQRARPRRQKTEHLHSTVISVMILKTQCYGNIDDNIRYHINGSSYMKACLQRRNSCWSEPVWNSIDIQALGRHDFTQITLAHCPSHPRFVHNLLPLGDRKCLCSTIKDPNLQLCPCCLHYKEDPYHFLHCKDNGKGLSAIKMFLTTILKDSHPSRLAFAVSIDPQ